MLKDLRGMSIDRERAIRAIALIGLLILGLLTLPGLLETPAPPPVPSDVGFTPRELARFAEQPLPAEKTPEAEERSRVKQQAGGKPPRRAHRPARTKREVGSKPVSEKASAEDDPVPSAPPASTSSAPVPSPAPPVGVPPPQYSVPVPAPPPLPTDGSQEFAPR